MFIVYNMHEPSEFEVINDSDQATKRMFQLGDNWDITNKDTFKSWYPDLNVE